MEFTSLIEDAGKIVDLTGVVAIIGGIVVMTVYFAYSLLNRHPITRAYEQYRSQ